MRKIRREESLEGQFLRFVKYSTIETNCSAKRSYWLAGDCRQNRENRGGALARIRLGHLKERIPTPSSRRIAFSLPEVRLVGCWWPGHQMQRPDETTKFSHPITNCFATPPFDLRDTNHDRNLITASSPKLVHDATCRFLTASHRG